MARRGESRCMTSQPTLIPHLIDAVNALSLALTAVTVLPEATEAQAIRQDSLEHLSEAELLLELVRRQLSRPSA